MDTFASKPGNINVNFARYFRLKWGWAIVGPVLAVVLALAGPVIWPGKSRVWYFVGALALAPVVAAYSTRTHFAKGCLLPGRVISNTPLLVASITDLANGRDDKEYYCLAVQSVPAGIFDGQAPALGDECPVVAMFAPNSGKPFWSGFDPRPVKLASGDATVFETACSRLDDEDLQQLDLALQLTRPTKPGRWCVDVSEIGGGTSGWPNEKLGKPV